MKVAILFLASLALVAAATVPMLADEEYEFLFTAWAKQHGKTFAGDEAVHRFNVWKANLDYIRTHNAAGKKSHTLAMNQFGDLTNEEFRSQYNNFKNVDRSYIRSRNYANLSNVGLPDSVDWNKAGKLTPVKDQGQCGSCWSFSSTGAIEGAYAIAKGSVVSLSEQELVDCSAAQGNNGCNGGLMDDAFQFVISNGGLCTESSYPYVASQNPSCNTACSSVVTISGFQDVTPNSEDALQAAVASQPVSIAVDAGGSDWQFYNGGVLTDACGTELDHGVLAAGYGTWTDGTPYWLVKNSWASTWGQGGYILLKRGTGSGNPGECGITLSASYPTGAAHA